MCRIKLMMLAATFAVILGIVGQAASAMTSDEALALAKAAGISGNASALAKLEASANGGDANAQFWLGVLYASGHAVPQDYAQAASWYRKAADQGNADAQNNLGHLYAYGQGVPHDYVQAASWYRKAADQGNADAQNNLGHLYANGQGVPQDYIAAYALFNLSADLDASSNNPAPNNRNAVAKRMTATQINKAQKLTKRFIEKKNVSAVLAQNHSTSQSNGSSSKNPIRTSRPDSISANILAFAETPHEVWLSSRREVSHEHPRLSPENACASDTPERRMPYDCEALTSNTENSGTSTFKAYRFANNRLVNYFTSLTGEALDDKLVAETCKTIKTDTTKIMGPTSASTNQHLPDGKLAMSMTTWLSKNTTAQLVCLFRASGKGPAVFLVKSDANFHPTKK